MFFCFFYKGNKQITGNTGFICESEEERKKNVAWYHQAGEQPNKTVELLVYFQNKTHWHEGNKSSWLIQVNYNRELKQSLCGVMCWVKKKKNRSAFASHINIEVSKCEETAQMKQWRRLDLIVKARKTRDRKHLRQVFTPACLCLDGIVSPLSYSHSPPSPAQVLLGLCSSLNAFEDKSHL